MCGLDMIFAVWLGVLSQGLCIAKMTTLIHFHLVKGLNRDPISSKLLLWPVKKVSKFFDVKKPPVVDFSFDTREYFYLQAPLSCIFCFILLRSCTKKYCKNLINSWKVMSCLSFALFKIPCPEFVEKECDKVPLLAVECTFLHDP
jgi:hypothetical protein